jgi:thiol-disulfide isomerase/thioredoxin
MREIFFNLILLSVFSAGFSQISVPNSVQVLNFEQFEPTLHRQTDTLYLINFWATWCAPCREELPAIQSMDEKYKNSKFKVILVSLDFPNQLESRLKPFIRDHHIKSTVILLNDPKQNQWIDKVDPSWSGEIPFTLMYSRTFRESYAKSFTLGELDSIIHLKIKPL